MSEVAAAPPDQLPQAPARLAGDDGAPRTGLFRGAIEDASFAALKDPWAPSFFERRFIEKKWQYVFVSTDELMLSLAIVDTGYLSTGICAVFDRGSRRLLANENPVLPPLAAHVGDAPADARLIGPGIRASFRRGERGIEVRASWAHTEIDLRLDADKAAAALSAVAPVGPAGRFDFTQKTVLVPAEGEVRAGNIRFQIRGELAGLDYTHGYLARDTAWRWAFAVGRSGSRKVAFNFSEGFLQGEGENALWSDGDPRPAGKVSFTFDGSAPLSQWRIRSDDGSIDLVFHPEGYRAQTIDLMLVASRYLQPFGTFSGRLRDLTLDRLPGVTEDHTARW